jgi:uncharacterized protein (DUF302 family)
MSTSAQTPPSSNVISKIGSGSVNDNVARLVELVKGRGMTVFAVIDHSGEAAPLSALDLPLKVLIWDDEGQTTISYLDPAALAQRYHLSPELAGRLAGIGPVTDALVAQSN